MVFIDNINMFLMHLERHVLLMEVFLNDDRLDGLMNHILMVLVHNVHMVLHDHILVMLVDHVRYDLLPDDGLLPKVLSWEHSLHDLGNALLHDKVALSIIDHVDYLVL